MHSKLHRRRSRPRRGRSHLSRTRKRTGSAVRKAARDLRRTKGPSAASRGRSVRVSVKAGARKAHVASPEAARPSHRRLRVSHSRRTANASARVTTARRVRGRRRARPRRPRQLGRNRLSNRRSRRRRQLHLRRKRLAHRNVSAAVPTVGDPATMLIVDHLPVPIRRSRRSPLHRLPRRPPNHATLALGRRPRPEVPIAVVRAAMEIVIVRAAHSLSRRSRHSLQRRRHLRANRKAPADLRRLHRPARRLPAVVRAMAASSAVRARSMRSSAGDASASRKVESAPSSRSPATAPSCRRRALQP